jgi:uncharacterized membrane protein
VKLVGTCICIILLWSEIDKHNPVLQAVCGGDSNAKSNCAGILQSPMAKIGGWISWSEIGFAYFAGGLLSLLFSGFAPSVAGMLSWINIAALPYTIFSVYFQWRVARQWCILCLTVQALLLLELFVGIIGRLYSVALWAGIARFELVKMLPAFFVPITAWLLIRHALITAKESMLDKRTLAKVKNNREVFGTLLEKQKAVTTNTEGLGITMGNGGAKYKIIKVCNPYCGPCSKAHPVLKDILRLNEEIQLQIIFTATTMENDRNAPPVKHFLAVADLHNEQITKKALDDWYLSADKDYNSFAAKYPMNGDLQTQHLKIKAMDEWCKKTNIKYTPTIFVNGYQLPEMYRIEDLQYLLSS